MKFIAATLFSVLLITQIGCNENRKKEGTGAESIDSMHRADSIKTENELRTERAQYQSYLDNRIDSLDKKLQEKDEIYAKRNEAEQARWKAYHDRMHQRIENLKKQKLSIATMTKDKLDQFKLGVDTAVTNFKSDWNVTMDKMKMK